MSKLIFNNSNNLFFQSLKSSVDKYFVDNKKKKTGDIRLYTKTIVLLGTLIGLYSLIMLTDINGYVAVLCCAALGYTMACIGFSVMHDANHGSYSTNDTLNDLIGLVGSNGLGANAYFWKQKHNIIHHTYTNVDGIDDDIAKSPIIRHCETQKWVPAHQIQHLYMPFAYSLSSLFWIFFMDFAKYFGRKINNTPAWKMSFKNHLVFWATKIYYLTFFIVLPIIVWGWAGWFIGFMTAHMVMGTTLSFVFQLAHVVENTEFEHIPLDTTKHIETAWAEHQIRTTSNFAMDNKIISWFTGGLNYQIEHHLFPKISHVHYPAISKIVREKCKEFNLPYNHFDTIGEAIQSHFKVMKKLGEKPAEIALSV